MNGKKVMIAESSLEYSEQLVSLLVPDHELKLCHNGAQARRIMEEFRPDILVLDLSLPGVDTLALLKELAAEAEGPQVLVTTCFTSFYVEAALSALGVALVVLKPCKAELVAERICEMTDDMQTPKVVHFHPRSTVSSMLMELNIPAKRRGFSYLEQGIKQYMDLPGQSLTKNIYPDVARENETHPQAVERAIRQVVHESWEKRDESVWQLYFTPSREGVVPRPTNAEFICRLAECCREKQEPKEKQA